jgi:hypothetical protein
MPLPDFINEPISVDLRIALDGQALPSSFVWREREVAVCDVGRTWGEESDGGFRTNWLVRSPQGVAYELQHDPARGTWILLRMWGRSEAAGKM